jgi:nitrous oxidase accessory protein NosD
MTLVRRSLTLGVVATALVAATSVTAQAATIQVFHGDSIQDAVDNAHRGDTIVVHQGTFRGGVKIKKNRLTLRGAGDSRSGTVIKPGSHANCDGTSGICIGSRVAHGHPIPTVGTHVSGFRIQGFRDFGAIAFDARKTVFRNNKFIRNDEYGVAAFSSKKTKFLNNVAIEGEVAGFYVGDSPHANAVLRGNLARRNHEFGFFLRDSSHAVVAHNRAVHNCVGMILVNTGSPGGVHDWSVRKNRVLRNHRRCPAGEGGPPLSGTGIGLLGASHNRVRHNLVKGNRPSGAAAFPGGIVVASSTTFGGSNAAHNRITHNRLRHNEPADLLWDGKGKGNLFTHNRCQSSQPGGLCQ